MNAPRPEPDAGPPRSRATRRGLAALIVAVAATGLWFATRGPRVEDGLRPPVSPARPGPAASPDAAPGTDAAEAIAPAAARDGPTPPPQEDHDDADLRDAARAAERERQAVVGGNVSTIDGEPIAGARVRFGEGEAARTATTGADGEFRFDGVGRTRHALRVEAEPFTPFEGDVAAGDWIDVELWHGPVLDLRVSVADPPSPALGSVHIGVARDPTEGGDGWPIDMPVQHAHRDGEGWRLVASLHRFLQQMALPVESRPGPAPPVVPPFRVYVVLADGRHAMSDAVAPAAEARRVTASVVVAVAPTLHGRLLDLAGQPIPGLAVSVQPDEGVANLAGWVAGGEDGRGPSRPQRTDDEGRFALPLSGPGPFRLYVGGDRDGRLVGPPIRGGTHAPRDEVEFRMAYATELVAVRGVLRDASGEAVPDAIVSFAPPDAAPREIDGGTFVDGVRQAPKNGARTASDGTFSVQRPLRAGAYLVTVHTDAHQFAPFGPVTVAAGTAPLDLRLPVRLRAGWLRGRLSLGGAPLRATITVWPLSTGASGYQSVATDAEGRFQLEIPDRFPMALLVLRDGDGICHAERIERDALGRELHVAVLEPARNLAVRHADGSPVPEASLDIVMTHDGDGRAVPAPAPSWDLSVAEGRLASPLPRGRWFAIARRLEWSAGVLGWADIDARNDAPAAIALRPARAIEVRVLAADGRAVAGALVELEHGRPMRVLGEYKARTGPEGVARLAPCFPMDYRVRVRALDGAQAEGAVTAAQVADADARIEIRLP